MQRTSCRSPEAAWVVNIHLIVFWCLPRVAVVRFVLRIVVTVAQTFSFPVDRRKEVLDGSAKQVSSLCRHVFENLLGWRFAVVNGRDFVCSREDLALDATGVSVKYGRQVLVVG